MANEVFSARDLENLALISQLARVLEVDLEAVVGYKVAKEAMEYEAAEGWCAEDAEAFFRNEENFFIDNYGDIVQYARAIYNQLNP